MYELIIPCYDLDQIKDMIEFTVVPPTKPGVYFRFFKNCNKDSRLHLVSILENGNINAPAPNYNDDLTKPIVFYSVYPLHTK